MKRQIVFFDVAGTLVASNPWRGLLKHTAINKVRLYSRYPFIVLPYWAKNAGLISDVRFRQIWIRQMAALLKGLHRDEVNEMFRWIAADFVRDDYRQDVVARLDAHKQAGAYVLLVSGMFTPMTQAFATKLGADAGIGTGLAFDEQGICTGHIAGDGCAGENKSLFIRQYLEAQGLSLAEAETTAYADSYSDVPLLSFAQQAVATYPDEKLREVVRARGWSIIDDEME